MRSEYLAVQASAARRLDTARARHARLLAQADADLDKAKARHGAAAAAAAAHEARAWRELLKIPGVSIASASQLTGLPPSTVRAWLAMRLPDAPEAARPASGDGA